MLMFGCIDFFVGIHIFGLVLTPFEARNFPRSLRNIVVMAEIMSNPPELFRAVPMHFLFIVNLTYAFLVKTSDILAQ